MTAYARDAFFLLRGFTGASLLASTSPSALVSASASPAGAEASAADLTADLAAAISTGTVSRLGAARNCGAGYTDTLLRAKWVRSSAESICADDDDRQDCPDRLAPSVTAYNPEQLDSNKKWSKGWHRDVGAET